MSRSGSKEGEEGRNSVLLINTLFYVHKDETNGLFKLNSKDPKSLNCRFFLQMAEELKT
jgi:hypothetical protein